MCGGGAPSPPAQVAEAPTMPDVSTKRVTERDQQRRSAAGTILTSPRGVTEEGQTARKTLLGQ